MVTTNPLLAGARGGLGKVVVFKQMYGKTVMTNYPRKADIPREKQSAAQRGTRDNFRDAVAYAKAVLQDPVKKAYYEKKKKQLGLNSAYQAAITDYMRKLKLESVNGKQYTGEAWRPARMYRGWASACDTPARVVVKTARAATGLRAGGYTIYITKLESAFRNFPGCSPNSLIGEASPLLTVLTDGSG